MAGLQLNKNISMTNEEFKELRQRIINVDYALTLISFLLLVIAINTCGHP
jgi:hypothetical protein